MSDFSKYSAGEIIMFLFFLATIAFVMVIGAAFMFMIWGWKV